MKKEITWARASRAVAAVAVAAFTFSIPIGAQASVSASPSSLVTAANTAVDEAKSAYVDEDYAAVPTHLDVVDASEAELERLLADAQAKADVLAAKVALDAAADAERAADNQLGSALGWEALALDELNRTPSTTEMCTPGIDPMTPMCTSMPNPQYGQAQLTYTQAVRDREAAEADYRDALAMLEDKDQALVTALENNPGQDVESLLRGYVDSAAARDAADHYLLDVQWSGLMLEPAVAGAAQLRSYLDQRAGAQKSIVWALEDGSSKIVEGQKVSVMFSVQNTSAFALSAVDVAVTSPAGITPVCDAVEGSLAAGATVACAFDYTASSADADAGKVEFTASLTGYLPFGAGNPRAAAVDKTLVVVTTTLSISVAPAAVVSDGTSEVDDATPAASVTTALGSELAATGELAETGAEMGSLGIAAALTLVGAGLVVATRRRLGVSQ